MLYIVESIGDMFMKCEKCGSLLSGTEKFCNGCGTPLSVLNNGSGTSVPTEATVTSAAVVNESNLNNDSFASKAINAQPMVNTKINPGVESGDVPLANHDVASSPTVNISNPFLGTEIRDNRCAEVSQVNNNGVNANSSNVAASYSNTVNGTNTNNTVLNNNASINKDSKNSDVIAVPNVSREISSLSSNLNEDTNLNTTNTIKEVKSDNNNNSSSNKKSIKPIILTLLVLVLVASSFVIGYYFATNNADSEEKDNNPDSDVTPVVTTSTTYVDFGGKKIIIPEEYDYDVDDTYLYLKSKEWIFQGQLVTNTYSNVLKNKDSVKKSFESKGYKVTDVKEVAYDNTEYLVYTVSNSTSKILAVYSSFDSKNVWAIVLTNQTATGVDINWIEDLSKILTSATNKGIDKNLHNLELDDFIIDIDEVLEK